MSRRYASPIAAGFLLGLFVPVSAQSVEPELKITVTVFNYVEAPDDALSEGKGYAEEVFRHAGVGIEWMDAAEVADGTAGELPGNSPMLAMRIVPDSMIAGWAQNSDFAGFALVPANGEMGYIAGAYYERIAELARRLGCKRSLVLGYVIAHELGHLLLGPHSHSRLGIMAYPINGDIVLLAAQNRLHFTRSQAKQIRNCLREHVKGMRKLSAALRAPTR